MSTYKELRDAVVARVDKLNWTAYETNRTSTEKERNSMQLYQTDSKIVQDFYSSYREFINNWITENEDMIKRKLLRITKKEQILAIGMKED